MALDVKHYLAVYTTRMEMQKAGITNPSDEIKELTKTIVQKLSVMPLDELLEINNGSLIDTKGTIIVIFPIKE